MMCQYCGRKLKDDEKICPGCGEWVVDAFCDEEAFPQVETSEMDPLEEEPITTYILDTNSNNNNNSEPEMKKSKHLKIALTIGVCAVLGIAIAFFANSKTSVSNEINEQADTPIVVFDKKAVAAKGKNIYEVDKDGNLSQEPLYTADKNVENLISDNDNLYFTQNGDIVKLEAGKKDAKTIHEAKDEDGTTTIAHSDGKIYFTEDNKLNVVDNEGKGEHEIYDASNLNLAGLIIKGSKAYFTGQGETKTNGAIYEVDLTTGSQEIIYSCEQGNYPGNLNVTNDNLYFIQDDYTNKCQHIIELARKEDALPREIACSKEGVTLSNLLIVNNDAYFTKKDDEGLFVCKINLDETKSTILAKLTDDTNCVVDKLGVVDGEVYLTQGNKLIKLDSVGHNQKPVEIKPFVASFNNQANLSNSGYVYCTEDKVIYKSTDFAEPSAQSPVDPIMKGAFYTADNTNLTDAKQLFEFDHLDISLMGLIQQIDDTSYVLMNSASVNESYIYKLNKDGFTDKNLVVKYPTEQNESPEFSSVITSYATDDECIYYSIASYAQPGVDDGLYEIDVKTNKTTKLLDTKGISQVVMMDGNIYLVAQDWGTNSSKIYVVGDNGEAKELYNNTDGFVYYLIPYDSKLYFTNQGWQTCTIEAIDANGADHEVLADFGEIGKPICQGLNTYDNKLYAIIYDGDAGKLAGVDESTIGFADLVSIDLESHKKETIIDKKVKAEGYGLYSVEKGLVLDTKDSLALFDVETKKLEPIPTYKIETSNK